MNLLRSERQIDQLGVQQYRTGTMFYASYAMLLLGLLFFHWDPRFVFLGLTIEFAMGVLGNIVRTFISPGGGAALIAILLQLPSLGIALIFVVSTAFITAIHDSQHAAESGGQYALLGLALFFINALFNAVQRFRKTSLRQLRFLDDLNEHLIAGEFGSGDWHGVVCLWVECGLGKAGATPPRRSRRASRG